MVDRVFHPHPGGAIVDPVNSVNSEPKTADNRSTTLHLGSLETFGLTDAQLTAIRTNNGFAGGGAMTRDGQGAGGAGR